MPQTKPNAELGPRSPRFPSSKFRAPRGAPLLVHRSRLFEQLELGQRARLTLVVGSAGVGKTALLADWVATRPERSVAWLSCDVADADPVRFVAAIIEALRRTPDQPVVGEDARQLLSLDGEVSADVIAALADDLERPGGTEALVIDDFQLTGGDGTDALALLLEYWPPSVQLVVASRVDPQLRLYRMRANRELVELRDRDLSFSAEETRVFLLGFGVRLSEGDLAAVHQRSEGWAAGLQMAAISINQSLDPSSAAGRVELLRHSVAGFFLEEVLYRQEPQVVDFMLATSVLDELSTPACTALCGQGSAALLQFVYSAHLFLTMLDQEAGTYRYHQLIKEVLQAELHGRDPARERLLHTAVATHLADSGRVDLAARHLLAAGDPAAAFRLLSERVVRDFFVNPTVGSALDLDEVQPDLFTGSPEILVPLAVELLVRGAFERGSRAFALAQQADVDPERQPELAFRLAILDSTYSALVGRLDESLAYQERARSLADRVDGLEGWGVGQDVLAMYCHTYLGEFSAARQVARTTASAPWSPPPVTEVLCPGITSQVALAEGALTEAATLALGAIAAARRLGVDRQYLAFCALRTTALLALERRDLATAAGLTEDILGMLGGGRPHFDFLAQLDRARIWAAAGNLDEALASLPAARTALKSDRSVLLAQADELEARFRVALGDQRGALGVAERLPDDRRLVVSALIALGAQDPRSAAEPLSRAPLRGPTIRTDLELRLLRATTAIMQSSYQAPQLVKEALAIADRHGFVQTVLETSPPLVDHLVSGSTRYESTDNLMSLIAAGLQARKLDAYRPPKSALPEPLTDAEIRVLEKLPQRLTYLDMASDLHLSLNTVKTHLRHTYMKLGVSSRSSAVKRATSLGLL
jgi:LuxR family transcriptional regulator, maltose regulon positive regulatory protein